MRLITITSKQNNQARLVMSIKFDSDLTDEAIKFAESVKVDGEKEISKNFDDAKKAKKVEAKPSKKKSLFKKEEKDEVKINDSIYSAK
jgi:hypothetical protein